MTHTARFPDGNYCYLPGVFQYSAGVAAEAGFEIERARLLRPVSLVEGFTTVEAHLMSIGRPLTAFCACELRSPAPFTEEAFKTFNLAYVGMLEKWGIFKGGTNPVARSNVCPAVNPPRTPSFYAFSYTVPTGRAATPSFHVAGSAEAPEGKPNYGDHIVRRGDRSADGLREKARFVLGEMERRMKLLGFSWKHVTATQLYTVYDPYSFLAEDIAIRGAMPGGLTWHFCRPPIVDLDYEMDVRGLRCELVL